MAGRLVLLDRGEAGHGFEEEIVVEVVVHLADLADHHGGALAIEAVRLTRSQGDALAGSQHDRRAGRDPPYGAVDHGVDVVGRDQFAAWLERVAAVFPDLRFTVADVAVAGWPWNTRVAVRLLITATLADGSAYRNEAAQWIRLRWGRMVDDWVLEDTAALNAALSVQSAAA